MAVQPAVKESPEEVPGLGKPLTEEEKQRLGELGLTEEEVARNAALRFAGVFADDPDFMPIMRQVFRASRGREMPE